MKKLILAHNMTWRTAEGLLRDNQPPGKGQPQGRQLRASIFQAKGASRQEAQLRQGSSRNYCSVSRSQEQISSTDSNPGVRAPRLRSAGRSVSGSPPSLHCCSRTAEFISPALVPLTGSLTLRRRGRQELPLETSVSRPTLAVHL